jgi:hypothetical protein
VRRVAALDRNYCTLMGHITQYYGGYHPLCPVAQPPTFIGDSRDGSDGERCFQGLVLGRDADPGVRFLGAGRNVPT